MERYKSHPSLTLVMNYRCTLLQFASKFDKIPGTMGHFISRKLRIPFEDAVQKLTQNLQQQGFGVITTIDLQDILKRKLNIAFRRYQVLGVCNPEFAYKAITLESHLGVMLACNLVVQERENGEVEVSAINPLETVNAVASTPQLSTIAKEVSYRLRAALDDLQRNKLEPAHPEALPNHRSWSMPMSAIG